MRYQVISAYSLKSLADMVNVELSHDWNVTGGLIAYYVIAAEGEALPIQRRQCFAQALIRLGPAEENSGWHLHPEH